jgi:hypothetical protein
MSHTAMSVAGSSSEQCVGRIQNIRTEYIYIYTYIHMCIYTFRVWNLCIGANSATNKSQYTVLECARHRPTGEGLYVRDVHVHGQDKAGRLRKEQDGKARRQDKLHGIRMAISDSFRRAICTGFRRSR